MVVWHFLYETCHGRNSALCLRFGSTQVILPQSMLLLPCLKDSKFYYIIFKLWISFQIYCHSSSPSNILKDLDMPVNKYWFNFFAVTAIYFLLKVFTYLVLKKKLEIHWWGPPCLVLCFISHHTMLIH